MEIRKVHALEEGDGCVKIHDLLQFIHPWITEAEGCSTILLFYDALCFVLPSVALSACDKFSL